MKFSIRKIVATIVIMCFIINIYSSTILAFEENKVENTNNETIQNENESNNENKDESIKIDEKSKNIENQIQVENNIEKTLEKDNETDKKYDDNNVSVKENVEEKNIITNEQPNIKKTENNLIENSEIQNNLAEDKPEEKNMFKEENEEKIEEKEEIEEKTKSPIVKYNTHIQNIGWQDWKTNGEMSGTSGRSLRLEALNINLENISNINVKYQVHIQNIGWQNWKTNGEMAGTSGRSLRLEALRIQLDSTDDYSIMYRVHVQNIGWQDWKIDGELAGTEGKSLRLEALEIKIVPKIVKSKMCLDTANTGTIYYSPTSIKVKGWKLANISNTYIKAYFDGTEIDSNTISYYNRDDVINCVLGYGTKSQNLKSGFEFNINTAELESGNHTILIELYSNSSKINSITSFINNDRNLHVKYQSHIQNIGWQEPVLDAKSISGTTGQALRIEAININLINAPENAKIKYKAHVQNEGWQTWRKNGEISGTSNLGRRIEAIQIVLENMPKNTVEYRVHVEDIGWTGWYIDGETAGTIGQSKRIEAIQIRIVNKYKREYKGIDVSQFQGNINWQLVKASGIEFAFIRVGYRGYGKAGNFREDSMYWNNMNAAKNAGIKVGVYFVTQATTYQEAVEEAIWVLERVKPYKIEFPIALDLEEPGKENPADVGRAEHLDRNARTYLAKVFCETIQNSGYIPMIYTNLNWANNKLYMAELNSFDTWIAQYNSKNTTDYTGKYSIWQYTSQGIINGIFGAVDLNKCYKKY